MNIAQNMIIYFLLTQTKYMPRTFIQYLQGCNIYACTACSTHLTCLSELISKSFQGPHGPAYLFNKAINVRVGDPEQTQMTTGIYRVCNIYCLGCNGDIAIGWTYIHASERSQKYKEGRFIIAQKLIGKENWTAL